ncbi:class I SAM-dependent methyltransferase [Phytoactinopolyspora halotolerans]|uniref:Class I SAM-dependent methyltransferase n=1 Tax=Phytoactinopolyspora halotolerans TaxID=1981512 RepID=A0A6L9S8Y0_9ACTN|nr:class I SAM-dependent methyltransferase [Phytoactinopolyspora halotolerans]NEE00988.1 class I SAM-dependent methyltransferase [Phytoactinopolyspora halotolerans]
MIGESASATNVAADVQHTINRYWDDRAASYNANHVRQVSNAQIRAAWVDVWSRALPPSPARILDVGTGTGHVALLLAELGYDVVGIDLAPGMLEQARAKAGGLERPPVFLPGDAVDPDVEPRSFDAVTARYVLWTLRTPELAVQRWLRLLRRDGTLAVVDSTWFPDGIQESRVASDPTRALPEFAERYNRAVVAALPLAESATIDDSAARIRAAGFEAVTVQPLPELLELDRRFGVADGHDVRMQYLITGRSPAR